MLNRRDFLAATAVTAIVASTPVLAAVSDAAPVEALPETFDQTIQRAIATLQRYNFDLGRAARAFHVDNYAPRTDAELTEVIQNIAYGNDEMRTRVRLIADIGRHMRRKYATRESEIAYLMNKELLPSTYAMDHLETGSIRDLEVVGFYVCG
jgi:hypothetical protein